MPKRRSTPASGLEVAKQMNFNVHRRFISEYKAMCADPETTPGERIDKLDKIAKWFVSPVTPEVGKGQVLAQVVWGGDE